MILASGKEAREIDARATQTYQIPSIVLMEHAAIEIQAYLKNYTNICIVCGPGNNGADGMALARLLYLEGKHPIVMQIGSMNEIQHTQANMLEALGIKIHTFDSHGLQTCDVIVDCLFGNGLSREVTGVFAQCIHAINAANKPIISVDLPSGLQADTGEILGTCIQADETLALDCYKMGHWVKEGPNVCGNIHLLDISIPHEPSDGIAVLTKEQVLLPIRGKTTHKGSFGKAFMIGGSYQMPGAITMAAKSCYASGIGTLTVLIPDCIADLLSQTMDGAMRLPVESVEGHFINNPEIVKENIDNYDVISIGNGMGRTPSTTSYTKAVLQSDKAVILDADAFYSIQDQVELLNRKADTILTPHIKELSYVLKMDMQTIVDQPFQAVDAFCSQYPNCTLILKSYITIIGQGKKRMVLLNPNSALAKGGSGDLLCGIVTALYGQSKDAWQSAINAVAIHSYCANTKKDPACVTPDDILNNISNAFNYYR